MAALRPPFFFCASAAKCEALHRCAPRPVLSFAAMISPYLMLPQRSRRDVLRNLIAKLQVELERTHDPADRARIEQEIQRLQDELRQTPE
jgi:hypothetical protein